MTTDTLDSRSPSTASRRLAPWILSLPLSLAACAVEPGDAATAPAPEAPELKHCAVELHGETTCYATFDDAVSRATAGRITDATRGAGHVMDDAAFAERVNALGAARTASVAGGATTNVGTTLIGIVYKSADFSLDEQTWTFFVPGRLGCDGNLATSEFSVENLNTSPYTVSRINDGISSFRSFNNCRTVLWSDWFFGGAATNFGFPLEQTLYVGDAMNDRASSIAWF